jgi:hypothetical protein
MTFELQIDRWTKWWYIEKNQQNLPKGEIKQWSTIKQPTKCCQNLCCQNLDWGREGRFLGFREQQNIITIVPWIKLKTMWVRTRTSKSTTPAAPHCCSKHRRQEECPGNGGRRRISHLLATTVGLTISFECHGFESCLQWGGFGKGVCARHETGEYLSGRRCQAVKRGAQQSILHVRLETRPCKCSMLFALAMQTPIWITHMHYPH